MTRLLVLGLLDVQPMSGYDIQNMLTLTDAERWAGVLVGSIYHALKKMETEGLVAVDSIELTGHRQKAIYKITDKGRAYLKEIAVDALKESSVLYPSALYSGLSYVHKLPKDEALAALRRQEATLDIEANTLQQGLEAKTAALSGIDPVTQLIFDNMFETIRRQQAFIRKVIALLESR